MNSNNDEISSLFERLSIKEVQEYERKTRAEIEKRKEDLRVMVGERYRDLIEAADTIQGMKTSVECISKRIKEMHEFSSSFNPKRAHSTPLKSSASMSNRQCYSVSAKVKLLLNIPEKIWSSIENCDLLRAAYLYLFAQHVHTNLKLEVQQDLTTPISACFPVITGQWSSIIHFRTAILDRCETIMKFQEMSTDKMSECLSALILLTDTSQQKVCNDFLAARLEVAEKLLNPTNQATVVSDQISGLVNLIKESLCQLFGIFFSDSNQSNAITSLLVKLQSNNAEMRAIYLQSVLPEGAVWVKYLPPIIKDFVPTVKPFTSVSGVFLKETCQNWIKLIKDNITTGVNRILSFISNAKGLATIQEAVQHLVAQSNSDEKWIEACKYLLQKEINIWEEFLGALFVHRAQSIVQFQLQGVRSFVEEELDVAISEISSDSDYDISDFIWIEGPADLPAKFVWGHAENSNIKDVGNLTMKTKGFTPRVQTICTNLDDRLKVILDDVLCFAKTYRELSQKLSVDITNDINHIQSNIQTAFSDLITSLLQFMQACLGKISTKDGQYINRALLLARLCHAMSELCPHLQRGVAGWFYSVKEMSKDFQPLVVLSTGRPTNAKLGDDHLWQMAKTKLLEEKLFYYNEWRSVICHSLLLKSKELQVPANDAAVLKYITQWDRIEIQEESEDGTKVNSSIMVPMQPSWQIQSILYFVCHEINKVGTHIIPKSVLQQLQLELLNIIVTTYEDYLTLNRDKSRSTSQSLSLQLLFDVRFVAGFVVIKDEKEILDRIQAVCDVLEGSVYPFDLDVFLPYINNHLKRCIQRSAVLLGPLSGLDRLGTFGTSKPALSSHQEQHNVLSLSAGSKIRFTLLPAGTSSAKGYSKLNANEPETLTEKTMFKSEKARSFSPQRSITPPPIGLAKSASSSFFGAMSSSWFGN